MPAPVPTGMLRLYLKVQNPVRTVDVLGQASVAWIDVGHVFGHVEQLRVAETLDDGGISTRSDYRFLTGWHPSINVGSRLVWIVDGVERAYNIRAVADRDQRRRRLDIEATMVAEE